MSKYSTTAAVAEAARNHLRDFPKFFEETYTPLTASTFNLSVPLVTSLEIRSITDNSEVTTFAIDNRNGVVKFTDVSNIKDGIHCYGYHYEWFLDDDLRYYADIVSTELMFDSDVKSLSGFSDAESTLLPIGTVVYALYGLMTEFSTDIDVSTPEGIMIPAHMRFQQTVQLFQFWKQKYDEKAALYNVGPSKISIYNLRRISRLTNRYVPTFKGREIDDPRWPVRKFPEIPELVDDDAPDSGGALINDYGVSTDGWTSFGQSGE